MRNTMTRKDASGIGELVELIRCLRIGAANQADEIERLKLMLEETTTAGQGTWMPPQFQPPARFPAM